MLGLDQYIAQVTVKQIRKQQSGNVVSISASLVDRPFARVTPYKSTLAKKVHEALSTSIRS
jgi:hypothetical protein